MIVPRDSNDDGYYDPWGTWGRWVLLAVVVVFIIATILSFTIRRKAHAPLQEIPLAPVYPHDPMTQNPPPPKYEPEGQAYTGPVWQGPEKGQYMPPPGPPPAATYGDARSAGSAGSSSGHYDGDASAGYASPMYGPPPGAPPRH